MARKTTKKYTVGLYLTFVFNGVLFYAFIQYRELIFLLYRPSRALTNYFFNFLDKIFASWLGLPVHPNRRKYFFGTLFITIIENGLTYASLLLENNYFDVGTIFKLQYELVN